MELCEQPLCPERSRARFVFDIFIYNRYMENWKEIKGYEGLYLISDCGRVRSLAKVGSTEEQIMRPFTQDGYLRYTLRKDGTKRNFLAHQLVARAFIPNPYNRIYLDHIDTDKTNNHVSNLRWVTKKENSNNPQTRRHNSMAKSGKRSLWAKGITVNAMVRT